MVTPLIWIASAGSSTTELWPLPDDFWQLRQLHWNIAATRPRMDAATAPQSQLAALSM